MDNTTDEIPTHAFTLDAGIFEPGDSRRVLEEEILPAYIARCRWFGGKARAPQKFTVLDAPEIAGARVLIVRVDYAEGVPETYLVPLQIATGIGAERIAKRTPQAVAAKFQHEAVLFDAVHAGAFRAAIYGLMARADTSVGKITGSKGALLAKRDTRAPQSRVLDAEQSNTSVIYGDTVFLKLYRKLEEGVNPDAEITRFLTARAHFPHVPPFAGSLEYRAEGGEPQEIALALGLVPNEGDAWTWALAECASHLKSQPEAPYPAFIARVAQLGARTGELHLALACDATDPAFAPEPFTGEDLRELSGAIRESARGVFDLLRNQEPTETTASLLAVEAAIAARADLIAGQTASAAKTRTHGDYHLGQVLSTGADFTILDFEGEPSRPLAERRRKRSPLRDVAGMLRSFHYAAHASLGDRRALEPLAEQWSQAACDAFLGAWLATTQGSIFRPATEEECTRLLEAFLLEKAIYELAYELNNRPAWLPIPARGILRLLGK